MNKISYFISWLAYFPHIVIIELQRVISGCNTSDIPRAIQISLGDLLIQKRVPCNLSTPITDGATATRNKDVTWKSNIGIYITNDRADTVHKFDTSVMAVHRNVISSPIHAKVERIATIRYCNRLGLNRSDRRSRISVGRLNKN